MLEDIKNKLNKWKEDQDLERGKIKQKNPTPKCEISEKKSLEHIDISELRSIWIFT